eukprot:184907-Chlamydomonas_euryale.AAC.3
MLVGCGRLVAPVKTCIHLSCHAHHALHTCMCACTQTCAGICTPHAHACVHTWACTHAYVHAPVSVVVNRTRSTDNMPEPGRLVGKKARGWICAGPPAGAPPGSAAAAAAAAASLGYGALRGGADPDEPIPQSVRRRSARAARSQRRRFGGAAAWRTSRVRTAEAGTLRGGAVRSNS